MDVPDASTQCLPHMPYRQAGTTKYTFDDITYVNLRTLHAYLMLHFLYVWVKPADAESDQK